MHRKVAKIRYIKISTVVFSYVDEKLPHLDSERKQVPSSRTGTVQINDITDQASVSSTEMLVSNFDFAPVETF